MLGEKIYSTLSSESLNQIDLSSQANGVYFANLKTQRETYTQKIVIEK